MKPVVLLSVCFALFASGARAGDVEQQVEAVPQHRVQPDSASPSTELAPRMSLERAEAMVAEIRALLQAQADVEEAVVADLKNMSPEERDAVSRRIEASNAQLAIEILRVQLRYAQEDGLVEQAKTLEAKIALRLEAQNRPTHVAADMMAKNGRQPSIPTLPDVRPGNASTEKGFAEGGEQQ